MDTVVFNWFAVSYFHECCAYTTWFYVFKQRYWTQPTRVQYRRFWTIPSWRQWWLLPPSARTHALPPPLFPLPRASRLLPLLDHSSVVAAAVVVGASSLLHPPVIGAASPRVNRPSKSNWPSSLQLNSRPLRSTPVVELHSPNLRSRSSHIVSLPVDDLALFSLLNCSSRIHSHGNYLRLSCWVYIREPILPFHSQSALRMHLSNVYIVFPIRWNTVDSKLL